MLNPFQRAIAEGMARDMHRRDQITCDLNAAAETGPWAVTPEEVAYMWMELTEVSEALADRERAMAEVFHPHIIETIRRFAETWAGDDLAQIGP